MKASDFIIEELTKHNIKIIFGYIGGMIAHLVDSIYRNKNIKMVNTINEQGAGFAAEGYARAMNVPSVAIATSGPGATNLITPIADCFFDSTPVLFITGQVNTHEYRTYDIRQCGFQETNIVDIVKPITKYAKTINDVNDLKYEIHKAFHIMNCGRKGPVLLEIPINIQNQEIDINSLKNFIPPQQKDSDLLNVSQIGDLLNSAQKPLILIGNGINDINTKTELENFLDKTNIPVVESLHGIAGINTNYKYNLGFIGTYGNRYGNLAIGECDLLLVLGSRLDIRQTGAILDIFNDKTVVQVDIDEKELACNKLKKIPVKAHVYDFLKRINTIQFKNDISKWQKRVIQFKNTYSTSSKDFSLPNKFLEAVWKQSKENDIFVADVGQNQMWAAQSAQIKLGQKFLTSGGLGAMGFAIPAGIGASFKNRSIVITGDGGAQMNIQELEIIKRRNLPVKIIVMNNLNLGMIRVFQELYFDNRTPSAVWDYSAPDFTKIANAYGINAKTYKIEEVDDNIIKNFLGNDSPFLLNIILPLKTQVEPRLQFGNPLNRQHPLIGDII